MTGNCKPSESNGFVYKKIHSQRTNTEPYQMLYHLNDSMLQCYNSTEYECNYTFLCYQGSFGGDD